MYVHRYTSISTVYAFCYICGMELIDRLIVSNDVFIKSVLAQFAKTRKLPASAVSEMQCAGVVRELFGTLGATDDMAMEYIHTVLGRMPAHARKRIKPSESLLNFMDNRVDPGLLHKYHLARQTICSCIYVRLR